MTCFAQAVGDPQVSPDGRMIAFSVGTVDKAANKTITQIWTMNIDGSKQRQITNGTSSSSEPRWSPDGTKLAHPDLSLFSAHRVCSHCRGGCVLWFLPGAQSQPAAISDLCFSAMSKRRGSSSIDIKGWD